MYLLLIPICELKLSTMNVQFVMSQHAQFILTNFLVASTASVIPPQRQGVDVGHSVTIHNAE